MQELNIIICGVGGQGNVLVERIVGQSSIEEGYQVRAADTFGMSQRGGSVVSHLRIGHEVSSCLIVEGRCDIVLGLEPSEALSVATTYLRRGGLIILNTHPVLPARVKTGELSYPPFEVILNLLKQLTQNIIYLDATALAKEKGTERAMNIVMLGVLMGSGTVPINPSTIKQAMVRQVGPRLAQVNTEAFDAGFRVGEEQATNGGVE